jgi:hypothetical protein
VSRKLIYAFSLIGFFLIWGVFGSVAAAPRSEPVLQSTARLEENTVIAPGATPVAAIPVTGESQPGIGILLFYLLSGLGAFFLLLASLKAGSKQTIPHVHRGEPPDEP